MSRCLCLAALWVPGGRAVAGDGATAGAEIYRTRCASCHGPKGEGTADEYPYPLATRRSVAQLARFIARSMPADAPGECTVEEAERVAAYIREAFDPAAAPALAAAPRVGLTRLTVGQYRGAVADLIAGFGKPAGRDDRRGLLGDYCATSANGNDNKLVFQRLDPEVRLDFGRSSPQPEKIDPWAFTITWRGTLLAPETGEYEFVIRSGQSVRLWLNDEKRAVIDAWVKSGDDTEYRGSARLLGGRSYPLLLQFTKATLAPTTVKDKKEAIQPASIALEWVRPHRVAETVPARYLSPGNAPALLVLETPFPPDDRSAGFERGTSVSRAWDQAATDAAIEVADHVGSRLQEIAKAPEATAEQAPVLREFCRTFAERAFRRPLTDALKRLYIDRPFETAPDPATAVQRVLILVLKSPRFLYVETGGDARAVASRLALALWDSLPDPVLLKEADEGRLATAQQVAAQARRMASDPRAAAKLREFFLQWMRVDRPPDLAKSQALFPGFGKEVASDLRGSLELSLEDLIASDSADFRQLLLADQLYLNGRLARIYGAELPADAPFRKVALDPGRRAGLLSHPYLLAAFASTESSSPIHRGVFLARSVLGRSLRPPPDAFTPTPASLHPDLTTRQRVELQTKERACQSCHGLINPLGFALEGFDAIGRLRDRDGGKPIDDSGSYLARAGEVATFRGGLELARFLADSEETHAAFVERLFRHAAKSPIQAYGAGALPRLRGSFARNGLRIRDLLVEIATTAALNGRDHTTAALRPRDGHRDDRAPAGPSPALLAARRFLPEN